MEKINCSRDESVGQMHSDNAVQHNGCRLTKMLRALRRALQDSKRENKELASEMAVLKEEATENAALRKQAAENDALAADNSAMKEQLAAVQGALNEVVAQNVALTEQTRALAAESSALKRQLTAENVALKKDMDYTNSCLDQARFDLVIMKKSVDIAKAREEELEKNLEDLKTAVKKKEEENISLRADLQCLHMEKVKEHCDWEMKFKALHESYKEKLRCSFLEKENSFHQCKDLINKITETNRELAAELEEVKILKQKKQILSQKLSLNTNFEKETKEKKQEKLEHLETEKERKKLKREKKEREGTKRRKLFSCFLFKC